MGLGSQVAADDRISAATPVLEASTLLSKHPLVVDKFVHCLDNDLHDRRMYRIEDDIAFQ